MFPFFLFGIDKQSKDLRHRPIVKGTISITSAKIIILINLFIVLLLVFLFYPSIYSISIILLSFGFGTLYNIFSKRFPGADFFLSISMALFFLFGAVAVTENFQGFHNISMTTWILFILVFIHVFLMDSLGGGLKDAENEINRLSDLLDINRFLDNEIGSYSKGMKQKISMISAIMHKPKNLLLDEPVWGLDPLTSKTLRDFIKKRKGTTVIATHSPNLVEDVGDVVYFLSRGKVISSGDVSSFIDKNGSIEEAYFTEARYEYA